MSLNNPPSPSSRVSDRLLRLPEVEATTGLKKSTIYLLAKRGDFPRSVQISPRCVAWLASDVDEFIRSRRTTAMVVQPRQQEGA